MIEDIKKDFHKSLKELQESTAKELQALKEKQENTAKQVEIIKEKQENTSKQVMEMNKTILELKGEVDTIKKTQSEATLEIETLGKRSGTIESSISSRHLRVYPAQTSWFQDPAECILHSSREYQMAKGKHKNPTNRNQDHSPSSERSTPSHLVLGTPTQPKS